MVQATIGAVRTTAADIISTGKILAVVALICALMLAFSQTSNVIFGMIVPM
jgi:hypothetical protein